MTDMNSEEPSSPPRPSSPRTTFPYYFDASCNSAATAFRIELYPANYLISAEGQHHRHLHGSAMDASVIAQGHRHVYRQHRCPAARSEHSFSIVHYEGP